MLPCSSVEIWTIQTSEHVSTCLNMSQHVSTCLSIFQTKLAVSPGRKATAQSEQSTFHKDHPQTERQQLQSCNCPFGRVPRSVWNGESSAICYTIHDHAAVLKIFENLLNSLAQLVSVARILSDAKDSSLCAWCLGKHRKLLACEVPTKNKTCLTNCWWGTNSTCSN